VAHRYFESFQRARTEHTNRLGTLAWARTPRNRLPELNFGHLQLMTDSTGMLQHAAYSVPRYEHGYCLDDNARALLLMALVEDGGMGDAQAVRALASRYLAFVSHAFNADRGRFRNFMSYSRQWTEECGSEDSHGERCGRSVPWSSARSIEGGRTSAVTSSVPHCPRWNGSRVPGRGHSRYSA